MAYNDFLPSVGGFNPNMSLINPNDAQGLLGGALSSEMQQQMMPMGMMNRDGQSFMGQQQPQGIVKPEQGMSNADMMKMASMAMSAFNKPQMQIQNPLQIIHDNNQFRYAGFQQSPQQQMAQALRNRG